MIGRACGNECMQVGKKLGEQVPRNSLISSTEGGFSNGVGPLNDIMILL